MGFWDLETVAHSGPSEVQKRAAINNGWSEIFIVFPYAHLRDSKRKKRMRGRNKETTYNINKETEGF